MARSVILGIASAGLALALTASFATPSSAMSFNDYDSSASPLGNRADVSELFSGRLLSEQKRRADQAAALQDIREGRANASSFDTNPSPQSESQRPISLTLPF